MSENGTRSNRDRIVVRLENDRLCVFDRDGIYQARIRIGPNRYLWRSLKTRSRLKAISAARSLFHSIEYKQQEGLPLTNRKFSYVMVWVEPMTGMALEAQGEAESRAQGEATAR